MRSSVGSFIDSVATELSSDKDLHDRILAIEARLAEFLQEKSFVLDCLDRITASMESEGSPWRNPPLHSDPDLDYSLRLIYWPGRYQNTPHEHLSWGVTGVLHNELNINIYQWKGEPYESELIAEPVKRWRAGTAGHVLPPCIHSITNPGDDTSVSLHVFSGNAERDDHDDHRPLPVGGERIGQTIWHAPARKGELARGIKSRALLANVEMLAGAGGEPAIELLDRTFRIGGPSVKLASIRAMAPADPVRAAALLEQLAEDTCEPQRSEMRGLSERLARVGR